MKKLLLIILATLLLSGCATRELTQAEEMKLFIDACEEAQGKAKAVSTFITEIFSLECEPITNN